MSVQGFFTVEVPKMIRITDQPVWAMLNRAVQAAVFFTLVSQIVFTQGYEKRIPATGIIDDGWFDRSTIAQKMVSARNQSYCANPYSFNYFYCDRSTATGTINEYWCEDNIDCLFTDPTVPMYAQTPSHIWLLSYLKRRSTRRVDCTIGAAACELPELFDSLGELCQCANTRNFFVAGAEGGSYFFRHRATLDRMDSTRLPTNINTTVLIDVLDPATGQVVEADKQIAYVSSRGYIELKLDQLLQYSGLGSLDTPNPAVAAEYATYPSTSGNPSLRITGVNFQVRVIYSGSLQPHFGAKGLHATAKITTQLGWHSVQDLAHGKKDLIGDVTNQTRVSTTSRGAHFHITFGGSVGVFDGLAVVTALANVSVFLVASSLLVQWILLFLVGYKSNIFYNSAREEITVQEVHTQKAVQALIAATTLSALRARAEESAKADLGNIDAGNGNAFIRTAIGELKAAGASDTEAQGLAKILQLQGETGDFHTFADSSSYHANLPTTLVSAKGFTPQRESWATKLRDFTQPHGLGSPAKPVNV